MKKRYVRDAGVAVDVFGKRFFPDESSRGTSAQSDHATLVFLPGWSMSAHDAAVGKFCRALAHYAGAQVLAVESRAAEPRAQDPSVDILYEEARAIGTYLEEHRIGRAIIIGHSRGGDKAISLASVLAHDSAIPVDGLILLDAVGLYAQKPWRLAAGFYTDTFFGTPWALIKDGFPKRATTTGVWLVMETAGHVLAEIVRWNLAYPRRFMREVREMARQNPHAAEVRVPVVAISGAQDPVSNPRFMPEAALRALFTQSPGVYGSAPEKRGHHGVPFFYPETVARESLGALAHLKHTIVSARLDSNQGPSA